MPKDAQVFFESGTASFSTNKMDFDAQQPRIRKMLDDLETESSVDGDEVGDVFQSDSEAIPLRSGIARFLPESAEVTPSTSSQTSQTKAKRCELCSRSKNRKVKQPILLATNMFAVSTAV